jgi:hypothetical protein
VAVLVATLLLAAGSIPASATPSDHGNTGKVTLCHATNAAENPYVLITVDPASVFQQGHDQHLGPVFDPALHSQAERGWGDIIPSFDYAYEHGNASFAGTYPGLNVPEGQAILDNGCQLPPPPPQPRTTSLTVTKVVEGGTGAGAFPFTLVVEGHDDVTMLLADGQRGTATWATPGGAGAPTTLTVALTETDSHDAVATSAALGDAPLPGGGTTWMLELAVGGAHDVVVTNVFAATPPPTEGSPSIALDKRALVDADAAGVRSVTYDPDEPGTITYEYLVTNTGTTPLTDLHLVDDVLGAIELPVTTLAAGGATIGTATHTLTDADLAAGSIVNTATVTATAPDGSTVSAEDTETVEVTLVLADARPGTGPAPPTADDTEVLGVALTASSLPETGSVAGTLALLGAGLLLLGTLVLAASSRGRPRWAGGGSG